MWNWRCRAREEAPLLVMALLCWVAAMVSWVQGRWARQLFISRRLITVTTKASIDRGWIRSIDVVFVWWMVEHKQEMCFLSWSCFCKWVGVTYVTIRANPPVFIRPMQSFGLEKVRVLMRVSSSFSQGLTPTFTAQSGWQVQGSIPNTSTIAPSCCYLLQSLESVWRVYIF